MGLVHARRGVGVTITRRRRTLRDKVRQDGQPHLRDAVTSASPAVFRGGCPKFVKGAIDEA